MDHSVPRLFKYNTMKILKLYFQSVAVCVISAYLTAALILQDLNIFNWPKELMGMMAFLLFAFVVIYLPIITIIKLFSDL